MSVLDDLQRMSAVDPQDMHKRIYQVPEQWRQAWQIGQSTPIDLKGRPVQSILVTGLGGSAIGGDFVRCYLSQDLKIPLVVNRDYFLPALATDRTLCIASSYSGNTEETLSAYADARRKGAMVVSITSGGK